ncbi:MAG: hypothetical protein HYV07_16425 [Deltaproteobacteria bacterium]|nr:hypothetical protein [Deltaproteobacteria bacterium]
MRRRIWVEHLPPEELRARTTLELLRRFDLEPIVAVRPHDDEPLLIRALEALHRAGQPFGLWPLFGDDDGYWLSEVNAERFGGRVSHAMALAAQAGTAPRTIVFDLEPPLEVTRALVGPLPLVAGARRALRSRSPEAQERRARARVHLERIVQDLDGRFESLAAVPPPIALELGSGARLFQHTLGTEAETLEFDRISAMAYTSMIARVLPFGGMEAARGVLFETARALVARDPSSAALSLGVVGTGKLTTEATLESPSELARDVRAAIAADVTDLALFSLEGVLASPSPEGWLVAFRESSPEIPKAGAWARWLSRGLRGGLRWAGRR